MLDIIAEYSITSGCYWRLDARGIQNLIPDAVSGRDEVDIVHLNGQ